MCGQFNFCKFNFHFYKCCFSLSPSLLIVIIILYNYFLCLPSSALDFILFLIYHYPSFPLNIDLCFSDSILSFVTIIDWSRIEFYLHLIIDYFGTLISISPHLNSVFSIMSFIECSRFQSYYLGSNSILIYHFFYLNKIEHC